MRATPSPYKNANYSKHSTATLTLLTDIIKPMARDKVRYVCSNCGEASASWAGKCPQCGAWNTLQEQVVVERTAGGRVVPSGTVLEASAVGGLVTRDRQRLSTAMPDVDVVLGGGIVQGSVNLIAG